MASRAEVGASITMRTHSTDPSSYPEHAACGVGLVARRDGSSSLEPLDDALAALVEAVTPVAP